MSVPANALGADAGSLVGVANLVVCLSISSISHHRGNGTAFHAAEGDAFLDAVRVLQASLESVDSGICERESVDDLLHWGQIVEALAREDIDPNQPVVWERVDCDVGLGDDDESCYTPVLWLITAVLEHMRLADLGHADLVWELVEEISNQLLVSQSLWIPSESIYCNVHCYLPPSG